MTDDEEAFADAENYGYAAGYDEGYQVAAAELREKIKVGLEAEAKMRDQKAAKRGSAWSDDAVLLRDIATRIRAGEFG